MNTTLTARLSLPKALIGIIIAALIMPFGALTAVPVVAQDMTPEFPAPAEKRTITVNGTGIVNVDPDTADVSLGVQITDVSLDVAQEEVTDSLEAITQAVMDQGVAEEDIQTGAYQIYPIPEDDDNWFGGGVQEYEVFATIDVTVRDLDTIGAILDTAVTEGANVVSGVSFYVEDTDGPANDAREAAVADAQSKADTMAEATGYSVVGVYTIEEVRSPDPSPTMVEPTSMDMAQAEAADVSRDVPISPGQTQIRVEVKVVFEIAQPQG